jgi:DNA-directed RNA polymerase subunit E'/Rpb7
MQASILAQLKMNYEGKCSAEGYIQRNSITIVNYSLGRSNYIKGGVDYDVQFQADVCLPHAGQIFKAPVVVRSKIGIHADTPPIKVLIPRDLHIGNENFEKVEIGDDVEFEVVGSTFKQQDRDIVVVARLVGSVKETVKEAEPEAEVPVVAEVDPDVRHVVAEAPKPKRKLKQKEGSEQNVLTVKEGATEGAT